MNKIDKEYWKERYKDKWPAGNKREQMFKDLFEGWGYTVKKYGFEALSDKYNPESPDEKGKPDFLIEINKKDIYFEVTGTDVAWVDEKKPIWLRPDKVEYVRKHNLQAFCAHILDKLDLIRFIDMNEIDKKNSPLIHPVINGTSETYHEINVDMAIDKDDFRIMLAEREI